MYGSPFQSEGFEERAARPGHLHDRLVKARVQQRVAGQLVERAVCSAVGASSFTFAPNIRSAVVWLISLQRL
jgi:hypothetical protein